MIIKPLYRYENDDGSYSVTPIKRNEGDIPHTFRIIADEGMILVKGEIRTSCIDTNDTDGWTEEIDPDYPTEDTDRQIEEVE